MKICFLISLLSDANIIEYIYKQEVKGWMKKLRKNNIQ